MVKGIKFIWEILMWYLWFGKKFLPLLKHGGVILLGLIVVLSFGRNLPIPGNFRSLVVLSGSMEPTIHTGAVAIIKPSKEFQAGEIITFRDPRNSENLITHRVVEISPEGVIKTKGDANQAADNWEVSKDKVVGKFLFSIPYLGYAVNFARQPAGFLLLILLPALLIIISEIRAIKNELIKTKDVPKGEKEGKKDPGLNSSILGSIEEVKLPAVLLVSTLLLSLAFSSDKTLALLSDSESSTANTIRTAVWDVAEYCVVLNEILPNPEGDDGQNGLDGEWVELYNHCETAFDLDGWYITDEDGKKETVSASRTLGSQTVIGEKGSDSEWLVLFMNGQVLDNSGEKITLYNSSNDEVDHHTYGSSSWDSDSDSQNSPGGPNSDPDTEDPGDEGKSFARIPDGSGGWIDPVPTPGEKNQSGLEPQGPEEPEELAETSHDPQESSTSAKPSSQTDVFESSASAQPKED